MDSAARSVKVVRLHHKPDCQPHTSSLRCRPASYHAQSASTAEMLSHGDPQRHFSFCCFSQLQGYLNVYFDLHWLRSAHCGRIRPLSNCLQHCIIGIPAARIYDYCIFHIPDGVNRNVHTNYRALRCYPVGRRNRRFVTCATNRIDWILAWSSAGFCPYASEVVATSTANRNNFCKNLLPEIKMYSRCRM